MKKKIISILLAITFALSFAIVPSMAEGPLSVELLADKTNFVTSTDEQIVTISVILKNPAPTESKIAGVNFDLKTSNSNLQVSANEADIEKTDKFSNATFISNKFTGLNMDSSFHAVAIADTQITLLQFKVIIAANCPEGTYRVYTEDLVLSDVNSNSVYENNASISLTITTPHVHQWATEWTSDGTHHWHECTAEGCTLTAGTANSGKDGYAEHNWTAANCTTAKTCSICGKTEGSALGHDWADATCTAPKTCKRTGCTATDGSPLGHNWDTVWTIGDDQHWYKCNRTGCTAIKDAANHIPDRDAATEDDPVKCTECGKVLTPALGHVHTSHLTSVAAKAPTCTAPGNAAYWKCSCDKLFSDAAATTETTLAAVTKAALGHTSGDWQFDNDNHWKVCETCQAELDKAAHVNFDKWQPGVDGHYHECSVCHKRSEVTPHTDYEWAYDNTQHWLICKECGYEQAGSRENHTFEGDSKNCSQQCGYTKSSNITIITPAQPGDGKPAEGNPSTGAVSSPIGYVVIGLAAVGALCFGAKKLTKKRED